MMKIEAECLLGREMDEDEFEKLNHVYMESRLDKQAVCEAWKGQLDTRLLVDLADRAAHIQEEYSKLYASHRKLFATVKQNQDLINRIQWMNVKLRDCYVVFDQERMCCSVYARPLKRCFSFKLFNSPDYHRRLYYDSKEPMPKEAMDVLAFMGYEVEGPL